MRAIICAIAVALGAGPAADDFPPDESALVILAAAFDAKSANCTWVLRAKAAIRRSPAEPGP